jgi:hypothetical protein
LERVAKCSNGFIESAKCGQRDTQVSVGIRLPGLEFERAVKRCDGFVNLASRP